MLFTDRKKIINFNWFWITAFLFVFQIGCQGKRVSDSGIKPIPLKPGEIVVLGFKPAMPEDGKSEVIRSPFSGAVFLAEPVPQQVADKMTSYLFNRLLEYNAYNLIGPNQAKGVFASILSSDQGMSDLEIFHKIGKAFSAEAVIVGYIFRWRERDGTDYSVNRPASVAFDLYLIRCEDDAIIWKGKFDETQRSLSENILDISLFLKGKGRWLTAEGLAEIGMSELLSDLKP